MPLHDQFVTDPGDGFDTCRTPHQFLAQLGDMHIHGACLAVEIKAPGLLEQLFTREDASGLTCQGEQHFKFLRAQSERLTGNARLPAQWVHRQIGQLDGMLIGLRGAFGSS